MFIVLVLCCLASSNGQRPATDSSVVISTPFSSSELLSDTPESFSMLKSSTDYISMTLHGQTASSLKSEGDGLIASYNQYLPKPLTYQYLYSSPVITLSLTDTEGYSYSSMHRDGADNTTVGVDGFLQTSSTLEPSISSIPYEQSENRSVGTKEILITSTQLSAVSSVQIFSELYSEKDFNISENRGHSVDGILGSIIHLLESGRKIIKPEAERVSHEKATAPTRINDRGPPKIYPSKPLSSESFSSALNVHPSLINISSSQHSIKEEVHTVFKGSSPSTEEATPIIPSFSLVENEVSEGSSIETTPSLLNLTTSSSFSLTEDVESNVPVISTKVILTSLILSSSSNYTFPIQESKPNSEVITKILLEETQLSSGIPTGPITDWVPLIERPTLKSKQHSFPNNASELPILTEPSIFNLTVSKTIGQPTIQTDPRIFPSEQSTRSNPDSTNAQSTRSNSGSTHVVKSPNNDSKPLLPDYEGPAEEAAEIDEVIVTLLGSGTMKSQPSTTAPPTPGPATGRPYVIPVDIEEVRPFIGAQIPTRPSSRGRPQAGGGQVQIAAAGINVADENGAKKQPSVPSGRPSLVRPLRPRPTPPLVRIDTCIVGDESTCDPKLNEHCKTDQGISSCQCRPGYSRTFPRGPCQAVIKMLLSLRLDRIGDQKLIFNRNYLDSGSQEYQQLEYETRQAINSLFSYTPFARTFMGSTVNKFYSLGRKLAVNSTILLDESMQSANLRQKIRKEVVKALASRNNNLGESKLYVDESLNPVPAIEDLNECSDPSLNDCSSSGYCVNAFATFRCVCNPGFMDKYPDEEKKSGRICTACSPDYCNNHGICVIAKGQRECKCRGNYIGARCEIDGEVLGVALGASLAAMVIIVLTLVCLCVWNRRWKREQYKADMASAPSMGGYANKTITPINTYRLTIEDRVRWAHIADAMGSNYATVDRQGRPLTNKQEREESYYGHPGRPRSRLCVNGMQSQQPNGGYYNQDYPPRESHHPQPNRFLTAGTLRPYYS